MARKGDIDSKPVSARVPMEVFIKLQTIAFEKKKTMSAFLCDILSDDKFGQGGEAKIEYRDKLIPKIEYRDRIIEKEVPVEYYFKEEVDNPILIKENEDLKNRILELEQELQSISENIENKVQDEVKSKLLAEKDRVSEMSKKYDELNKENDRHIARIKHLEMMERTLNNRIEILKTK